MRDEQKIIAAWIERMRVKHGVNFREWAERAELGADTTISRAVKPDYTSVTTIPTIDALARALGEPSILEYFSEHQSIALPSGERMIAALGAALTASGRADLVNELAVKLARFLPIVLAGASVPLRNDPIDEATHGGEPFQAPATQHHDKQ
nr:hypothetical protein [Sphingomonas sp. SCN 67-18]